jgi:hypothetical protein
MVAKPRIKVVVVAVAANLAILVFAGYSWIAGPVSNQRYAVYSAFLEHERSENYHDFGNGNLLFQILDHTTEIPSDSPNWAQESIFVRREMALREHFQKLLKEQFRFEGKYRLLTKADFLAFPLDKRSLGLESFSDIVFTDFGTEAHFYYEHSYCSECGGGAFVTMRKVGTTWVVSHKDVTWVS